MSVEEMKRFGSAHVSEQHGSSLQQCGPGSPNAMVLKEVEQQSCPTLKQ